MASNGGIGGGKDKSKKGKKGSASATPSVRDCANCGAPEGSIPGVKKHSACSKCQITFYCSTKCQKQHWKKGGHKLQCAALVGEVTTPKAGGVELKTATPTAAPSPPAAPTQPCAPRGSAGRVTERQQLLGRTEGSGGFELGEDASLL